MENRKFYISLSILLHICLLGILIYFSNQISVFGLMILMFAPIFVNALICYLNAYLDNTKQSAYLVALYYMVINFCYWSIAGCYLYFSEGFANILTRSMVYSSQFVEVSSDNSPILSGLVFAAIAYIIYYFLVKVAKKTKKNVS